jgi:hypothetical protein
VKRAAFAAALLLLLAASGTLAAEPSLSSLEELRQRILRGTTATVEGRLYVERARPSAPDEPLVGVGVLLVPRSSALMERLDALKRGARESADGFRAAAPGVRTALEDYEQQLWRAGYPDAAVRTSTDAKGAFRIDVPEGAWILVAERSVYVPVHTSTTVAPPTASALDPLARYSTTAYQHFHPTARVVGYDAVSLWIREVEAGAGATVSLELHDRGLWLSGVAEDVETPRRMRFTSGGRSKR